MKRVASLWIREVLFLAAPLILTAVVGGFFGKFVLSLAISGILIIFIYVLQFILVIGQAELSVTSDRLNAWMTPLLQRHLMTLYEQKQLMLNLEANVIRQKRRVEKRKYRMATAVRGFRDSLSAMSDAIVLIDRQRRMDWWNPAAADLLGLSRSMDRNQPIQSLFKLKEFDQFVDDFAGMEVLELRSPTPEDRLLSIRLVTYGEDRMLLQARDITRIRHLEEVRRDFVANASHELRTPLTVVHGYIETLMDNPASVGNSLPAILDQMHRQTVRIKDLVEDMLTLSRIDQSEDLVSQAVAMKPLLKVVCEEAKILSGEKLHSIVLEATSGHALKANLADLRSIATNLVSNAIRYTPADGEINVRWWVDDIGAYLSVRDSGIGIEAEHISRITERFYRVNVAESRATGGTGLGLAIVKNVLESIDGELSITSKPGLGSTFTCFFPRNRIQAISE